MADIHPKHGVFCRDISLAEQEALIGSAGPKRVRLLIQDHSPWSRQGFENCALPMATKSYLKGLFGDVKKPSIMLVRNNDQRQLLKKSVFVVHSDADAPCIYHYYWETPEDLRRLPLADAMARRVPANFTQAMYLICTNGKRDKCCAKYGMPLYKQLKLRLGDKVWRSTHIGGDRFAANMLCLPHGLVYGRMTEQSATKAVQYYERGELSLEGLRGRSCYSKPVQVAESYLRKQLQLNSLNALKLTWAEIDGELCSIRFTDQKNHGIYDVGIQVQHLSLPRKLSCDAEKLEPVPSYKVVEFTPSRVYV